MAIDALVKPFLSLPIFRGLKPLQLTEIVRRADRVIYKPGDHLITEDEVADAAIVVVSGTCVQISSAANGSAGEAIPEGAILGEIAMLVETVHASSVIARTTVKALRIAREDLHRLMTDEPEVAEHFSKHIAGRLRAFADELRAIDQALADMALVGISQAGEARLASTPVSHALH